MKTRKFNFLHILLMMGLIVLPISCDKEAFLEEDLRDALSPAKPSNSEILPPFIEQTLSRKVKHKLYKQCFKWKKLWIEFRFKFKQYKFYKII